MNAGGRWFSVYATRDGFSSPSLGTTFVYLTPDCSGQRYGSAAGGGLVPNGQVLGSRAWYADLDGTPVTITGSPEAPGMFWFQQADGSGPVGPCSPSAVFTSITLYPMRSEDLSAFVPPFRLSD